MTSAARKPLIAGNWKMNLNHFEAIALVQKLCHALKPEHFTTVDASVLVPFTDIRSVQAVVESDGLPVKYGAQDLSQHDAGAYTGEVSGGFLAKLGCAQVVVGHSERRAYHHETDELVAAKVRAALRHGLTPILCVGEGEDIRDENGHVVHCCDQLRAALSGLSEAELLQIVVAYEPIWAIGTGRVASPKDAQEVCGALRKALAEVGGDNVARAVRILYGGSVNKSNAAELLAEPDVDGALVGGASLKVEEFAAIIAFASLAAKAQ
ncbi:triose-phosphate isomerase [Segniliparus rugosus]|uniref:Triosephosphate isomerase n=1 Tax=Segniliparus rugosus (strain ATCC BAA-974 / DSM 45345 / CCUG 50838 / CIP 108380 / JCM 13579 / CDC 945) TaxID=679197 RepID=E5XLC4_SEGRC|nr:triose-phosphate isomerase [Segniliparus rugosus]EFV14843.1 triose-phosphate isomerase [Segniliparus rugosus ATCC BAA-974]